MDETGKCEISRKANEGSGMGNEAEGGHKARRGDGEVGEEGGGGSGGGEEEEKREDISGQDEILVSCS